MAFLTRRTIGDRQGPACSRSKACSVRRNKIASGCPSPPAEEDPSILSPPVRRTSGTPACAPGVPIRLHRHKGRVPCRAGRLPDTRSSKPACAPARLVDLTDPIELSQTSPVPDHPSVAAPGGIPCAAKPYAVRRIHEIDLRADEADPYPTWMNGRPAAPSRIGRDDGIVVQNQNVIRAEVERPPDVRVVPARVPRCSPVPISSIRETPPSRHPLSRRWIRYPPGSP